MDPLTREGLETNLSILEDLYRKTLGDLQTPWACEVCYMVFDGESKCLCGRCSWMPVLVVLAQLREKLDVHANR